MESKQPPPYPLRMPDEMRHALISAAARGNRSLHAEILARLASTMVEGAQDVHIDRSKVALRRVRSSLESALNALDLAEYRVYSKDALDKADGEAKRSVVTALEAERAEIENRLNDAATEVEELARLERETPKGLSNDLYSRYVHRAADVRNLRKQAIHLTRMVAIARENEERTRRLQEMPDGSPVEGHPDFVEELFTEPPPPKAGPGGQVRKRLLSEVEPTPSATSAKPKRRVKINKPDE